MKKGPAIGSALARSLVQGLGDDCGAGALIAELLEAGTSMVPRGTAIGGVGPPAIGRAANDFTGRGWLDEDNTGWRRTDEPIPYALAAFLAGAQAMRSVCALEADAVAKAVVTLPAAPSTIARILPAQGPIHATFGRTEEVLGGIARSALTSFTVMSPFVNHQGAKFAMELFQQCTAPYRTLITRRAGTTKLALDPLLPTLKEMGVRVLSYLLPAGDGYETFHAKVVIADADKAYVGSANMTKYARHSMELGVVLNGRAARAVAALVRSVEGISPAVGTR